MRYAGGQRLRQTTATAAISLALGSGVAGLAGAGLALWLTQLGVSLNAALPASAGAAVLAGLAFALPLLARLGELDAALEALARGEAPPIPARAWPLEGLLGRVAALIARMADVEERERQAVAYRTELTRQVGEAAAREERNRLARELHDSIKQQLFSIGVSVAAARARGGAGEGAELAALDDIQASARAAQAEMTALLQQLRPAPLENVGLVEALRDQLTALGYRTGAEVSLSVGELAPEDRLPPRAQEELFRMAQEALANVARHARARHVWLRLERQGGETLLEVRDDGQGFDVATARGGMGLNNLRERARALGGTVEFESAVGAGTVARIRLPLTEPLRVTAPEELARQAALDAALERGAWWRQWALVALQVTFALVLLGLPFWAVALGIVASAALYERVGAARREIARLAGNGGAERLALLGWEFEGHAWLLIMLALCVWYLPVSAPRGWPPGALLAVVIAGSVALLAVGVATWRLGRQARARYYQLLSPPRAREVLEEQWRGVRGVWAIIGLVVALGVLFGHWAPGVPPHTLEQWSDAASIALLAGLCALNGVETWQTWRWRRALSSARESEARA